MYSIWPLRTINHNLITGEAALDVFHPNDGYKNFWEEYIEKPPKKIYIAESHLEMYFLLELLKERFKRRINVWNFDAHHDLGYSKEERTGHTVDCASWAWFGLQEKKIFNYHLIYPEWRKDTPEAENPLDFCNGKRVTADHGRLWRIAKEASYESPDYVFICRSPSWTPSWADDKWLEFIGWWGNTDTVHFLDDKAAEAREPNSKQAREVAREQATGLLKAYGDQKIKGPMADVLKKFL